MKTLMSVGGDFTLRLKIKNKTLRKVVISIIAVLMIASTIVPAAMGMM